MDPLNQLRSNVRVLTVDHQRMVTRDGLIEAGQAAGLIQQLREEIKFGSTKTRDGGGSSSGAFVPLDLDSDEIMSRIKDDLKRELRPWCVMPDTEKLEGAIHTWVKLVTSIEDFQGPAASLTNKWVKAIKNLFEPVKMISIPGDCPKCGVTPDDNGRMDDEGGWVHVPPLTVTQDMDAAKCAMCEYEWWGRDNVIELGAAVQLMAESVPRNMQG